jgi:hypothetical protein
MGDELEDRHRNEPSPDPDQGDQLDQLTYLHDDGDDHIMQELPNLEDVPSDAWSESSSLEGDTSGIFPDQEEVEGSEDELEEEDVEEEERDEITEEDLLQVLEERYGDEWRAQLHAIHEFLCFLWGDMHLKLWF